MSQKENKPLWFGMVNRWYDSARWRKARDMFLYYHPLCVFCEKRGLIVIAKIVDHKTPHNGDYDLFWDWDNWQPLCASCHSGVKRMQENHGYSQASGVDGLPLDANHPWNSGGAVNLQKQKGN